MPGFDNNVVYANNVDFSGNSPVTAQVLLDGQLLIGSSVAPHIRVSTLNSSDGSITITNSNGQIDLVGTSTLTFQTDGANAVPSAGIIRILGGAGITTSGATNVVTITNSSPGSALTITGDSGGALPPNWILAGSGSITTSGAGSTLTTQLTGLTLHAVLVGAGTTTITKLAIGATNQVLLGNTAADPSWGTVSNAALTNSSVTLNSGNNITVTGGGPLSLGGVASFNLTGTTNHAIQVGNATGSLTSLSTGSTGQVLQANTGADPTWSTATFPSTATGTGTILRADGTNWVATTATYPATTTVSQILYSSATNVIGGITTANNSILSTDGSGVPTFGTSLANDYTFTKATSGATTTLTISNTSNTSSSKANLLLSVAGSTADDAYETYTVSGVTSWSQGIDNSVSGDPFVLAASTALGTTNVMSATTGGAVSFVLGNLDVTKSASGVDVSTTVSNTSNTATSSASVYTIVAGSTAEDAKYNASITAGQNWTWGLDNSDSDAYVLSSSASLGTTNVMRVSTAGEINYPLQPAFLGILSAQDSNVTGDGTNFTIGSASAFTEVFDQNSDFNTNGTFTAPVSGRYLMGAHLFSRGYASGHTTGTFVIVTSNRSYSYNWAAFAMANATQDCSYGGSFFTDMDASDTCTLTFLVSGSTKVIDVGATTTTLSGCLIC